MSMRLLPVCLLFACAPAVSELQLEPRPSATEPPMPTDSSTTSRPALDLEQPTALRTATFALG